MEAETPDTRHAESLSLLGHLHHYMYLLGYNDILRQEKYQGRKNHRMVFKSAKPDFHYNFIYLPSQSSAD